MIENQAKLLYQSILRDGPPADGDPALGATAAELVDTLKAIRRVYRPRFTTACNDGDGDLADAIDMVLRRIGVMLFSIGQSIQRYIDGSADNLAAIAALDGIRGELKDAAEGSAANSREIGRATAALDGLAKVVGWVKDA